MAENVVKLDVREDILKGREPFTRIMAAVRGLAGGEQLLLVAPFEPVPLYVVLRKKGFFPTATRNATGDWEVLFTPSQATLSPAVQPKSEPALKPLDPGLEVDARGLEPPQPLITILEAVANIPKGAELRTRTDRRPLHLRMFSIWNMKELGHFGSVFGVGVGLFAWNMFRTFRRIAGWDVVAFSIASAISWLVLTMLAGLYVASAKCWPQISPFDPIALMHAHAHLGVMGCFVVLTMGVSFKLLPMFALSDIQNPRRAWASVVLLNLAVFASFHRTETRCAFGEQVLASVP